MDINQKLEARRREREVEAAARQQAISEKAAEQDALQTEAKQQKVIDAVRRMNLKKDEDAYRSSHDLNVGHKEKMLSEDEKRLTHQEANRILDEVAAKRIGGFWIFMALASIAIGAFLLFVEGWLGAIWIAAGLAVLIIKHEIEKRKLINER
jgi:hypothetical protein